MNGETDQNKMLNETPKIASNSWSCNFMKYLHFFKYSFFI